jgi:hypothetical protein
MTSFHTDEYIHFLARVTPDTAEELTYNGTRCESFISDSTVRQLSSISKFSLGMTTPHSRAYLSSAPFQQVVPLVRKSLIVTA